jgi:hypothetical protein
MSRFPSGSIAIVRVYEEPPDSMASSGPNLDREEGKNVHSDLENLNRSAEVSLLIQGNYMTIARRMHFDPRLPFMQDPCLSQPGRI